MRRRKRNGRVVLITAIVAAVLATSAYAFTASIGGVTPPSVGSGSGTIAGYTAGGISYNLNAANPLNVDSIQFTLANASATTSVHIQADSVAGTWYACNAPTGSAPMQVVCPTVGLTAEAANNLTIVAKG
jgi:hypothetical protein